MFFKKKQDEGERLAKAEQKLALLNTEMAMELIHLASKTGEVEPLMEAARALSKAEAQYTINTINPDLAKLQKKLGDTLLSVGKTEDDAEALDHAILALRSAVTLSSMLGMSQLRTAAKKNLALAENVRGIRRPVQSSYFAA